MTAPHRPRKLPRLPPPLDPSEWNFDEVGEDQIEACFWWEYCRESEEISADIAKVARNWHDTDDTAADNKANERALREADSVHLLGRDILRGLVWLQRIGHFPGSWMKLKPKIQAILAGEKKYAGKGKDRILVEVSMGLIRSMMPTAACVVEDELIVAKNHLQSMVSHSEKGDYVGITLPRIRSGQIREQQENRLRSILVTVDWRANDSEISKVLEAWLKQNRPSNYPEHKHLPVVTVFGESLRRKNGELIECRVALRWLGVLRREKHIEKTLPAGYKDKAFQKLYPGSARGKQAADARSVIYLLESKAQPREAS